MTSSRNWALRSSLQLRPLEVQFLQVYDSAYELAALVLEEVNPNAILPRFRLTYELIRSERKNDGVDVSDDPVDGWLPGQALGFQAPTQAQK